MQKQKKTVNLQQEREEKTMKTVRIALIGYGNVGRAFAGMLLRRESYIMETFHTKAVITAICTATRGGIIKPDGIDTETLTDEMFD